MYVSTWRESAKRLDPGFSQCCWAVGQEATDKLVHKKENWNLYEFWNLQDLTLSRMCMSREEKKMAEERTLNQSLQ